jgi:flagellar basal-body rod modification protein FlgD
MSTLNSILPTSTVQSTTNNTGNGFQSLSPSDFVNMMVTQLENQDPMDPTNSQDVLSQISQIGQLESADQLQTTLTGMTLQNQIGAASSLIGKVVQGTDANNNQITGVVSSVTITPGAAGTSTSGQTTSTVTLNLSNGGTLPLANVTAIAPAPTATTAATTPATTAATTPAAQAAATAASLISPAALAASLMTPSVGISL